MKTKKSEQLLARAALWQARVDALKVQAAAAVIEEADQESADRLKAFDALEAAARRALNDWSAPRIRARMRTIRELQGALMKLDYDKHKPRVFALDRLFHELRVRAEGFERETISKHVYAAGTKGRMIEEVEAEIDQLWEDHKRSA
jgi:hypothetical protein